MQRVKENKVIIGASVVQICHLDEMKSWVKDVSVTVEQPAKYKSLPLIVSLGGDVNVFEVSGDFIFVYKMMNFVTKSNSKNQLLFFLNLRLIFDQNLSQGPKAGFVLDCCRKYPGEKLCTAVAIL